MKSTIKILAFVAIITSISCRKDDGIGKGNSGYASINDFYVRNGVALETYNVDATTGGSFISTKGTQIIVPANAFVTQGGSSVSGNVTLEFKDIYKKSDMLLSDRGTNLIGGDVLVSAGEFFIKAIANNDPLEIAPGKSISIIQPQDTIVMDSLMQAFEGAIDSVTPHRLGPVWKPAPAINTVTLVNLSAYLFSLYTFSSPISQGTWCNSDNPYFFSAYPQTTLTVTSSDNYWQDNMDVFLVFSNLNSMVHVYKNVSSFPYDHAPEGFDCTVVAIGIMNGDLYSSFTPITITTNLSVDLTLTKTTTSDFKSRLELLN